MNIKLFVTRITRHRNTLYNIEGLRRRHPLKPANGDTSTHSNGTKYLINPPNPPP